MRSSIMVRQAERLLELRVGGPMYRPVRLNREGRGVADGEEVYGLAAVTRRGRSCHRAQEGAAVERTEWLS